ncbi:N-6 DNA methylase [Mycobacterium sp. ST-F2]|uniref:Eco57I restriction-modification methylase domain-containing protein n=1 Tax=Mycobacterium sp. ST-F2 TaxID=1490484 RepID=UPI0011504B57|nr:N-6 DNA methylase [Mycobacterium sp. ST-F2]
MADRTATGTSIEAIGQAWLDGSQAVVGSRLHPMAGLFGKNKLRELAQQIETDQIIGHVELVRTWQEDYHGGSLKKDNETTREQQYNQDFFKHILGYEEKPANPYTLTPKDRTPGVNPNFPDGVLRYTDTPAQIDNIFAVVELKGAAIHLDKPQQREGNLTPVQQAFKYKPQYRSCPFVVVSNFYEFRLYNDNQLDFERWTLDDLIDPEDDYVKFKSWYVLLRASSMVTAQGQSATQNLLSTVRQQQEEIGKKFYAEYKDVRIALLQDIWRNNPSTRGKFDLAIQKAQTIIDRIVFSCFAEDVDLLPELTIASVADEAERSLYGESLWDHFKRFFKAIDKGSQQLGIPAGYNGGLFAEDPLIDALEISDSVMKQVAELSRFDYREELRVNVLGHIFEQSISDLEEIRRKVREDSNPLKIGEAVPGRRKKEGIFYTPDYIVRFIVDNSLGAYLRKQEQMIQRKHRLTGRLGEAGYEARQQAAYLEYLIVLQGIKVIDIACGSGAFLVNVFDYLLRENERVNEILGGTLTSFDEMARTILSDNIFGVDLNPESVEITKLSLWLKTAQKGRPLTSLDNNIRCGNSVIDDVDVAGEKAFNWHAQFPEIMSAGGFDVVVGNPPYINARLMTPDDRTFLANKYSDLSGAYDIYVVFLLHALELLKPTGHYGWIIPNKFLIADYARKTLETMSETSLETVVNVSTLEVFDGVGVYPIIILGDKQKTRSAAVERFRVSDPDGLPSYVQHPDEGNTLRRFKTLADFGIEISSGTTGFEAQVVKGLLSDNGGGIPFAVSGGIDPYQIDRRRVPYMKAIFTNPTVALGSSEIAASKYAFWNAPKIAIAGMTKRIEAVYEPEPLALGVGVYGIYNFGSFDPDALTAVLNSSFMSFYLRTEFADKHLAGGYLAINKGNIEQLPMVRISKKDQAELADLARAASKTINTLHQRNLDVLTVVRSEYGGTRWAARKLRFWWRLDFVAFLEVTKLTLTLQQKDALLSYYKQVSAECTALEAEADAALVKIDEIVYRVFRITGEERSVIEAVEESSEGPLDQ